MTQMIMSLAKIDGRGPCMATYNGMVDRRMQRQAAEHRQEMEGVEAMRRVTEASRDRLLAQRLAQLRRDSRQSPWRKIRRMAVDAWCVLWAWALELGLVEEDDA